MGRLRKYLTDKFDRSNDIHNVWYIHGLLYYARSKHIKAGHISLFCKPNRGWGLYSYHQNFSHVPLTQQWNLGFLVITRMSNDVRASYYFRWFKPFFEYRNHKLSIGLRFPRMFDYSYRDKFENEEKALVTNA